MRRTCLGADVFYDVTIPKFATQTIKKAAEIERRPVHLVNGVSNAVGGVIEPAVSMFGPIFHGAIPTRFPVTSSNTPCPWSARGSIMAAGSSPVGILAA